MKGLKREVESIARNLKLLTQKTEKLAKKIAQLDKAQAAPKKKARPKRKARAVKKPVGKRAKKVTAIESVMRIIGRRKSGVNTTQIKALTGFDDKKIWNIINRLKQQKRIESARKGIYVKI
jgi:septal ring factor EnvC (AmiA/AmiB activator)